MLKFRHNIATNRDEVKLHLGLMDDIGLSLNQGEDISGMYMDQLIQESIDPIVDYEKRMFEPVISGSTITPVRAIRFVPHFRDRFIDEAQTELEETWATDDSKGWNNNSSTATTVSDTLDCLGFDEDDIYYRKSKVSKSFLRLSFYDKQSRGSQTLLFYSTIFLDSGRIYTSYLDAKSKNPSATIKQVEWDITCKDKYDMTMCSEGFYLYLFPLYANVGTIYMKAEFNNAKYGLTVPMLITKGGTDLPSHFGASGTAKYVDMQSLMNKLHYEIKVDRVELKKDDVRYIWCPPCLDTNLFKDGVLTIPLYEPRVNPTIS